MSEKDFKKILEKKEKDKLMAKQRKNRMWLSLGMLGIVGWSIVIPAFIGIGIGIWIDKKFITQFSWTLMLMFLGLIIGCANVWYWISKERKSIEKDKK
ncbi:MAG: AtpZ/AtpI family protein [Parachlamydiales bacterium]|jgi:ATP synthase protein I